MNATSEVFGCIASTLLLLSGTSVAIAQTATDLNCTKCVSKKELTKNAVTADKIRKSAVTKKKVKKGAINSKAVKDGSIRVKDLHPSALNGLDNVIYVSKSGGDFTSPVAALDSITDASASNRYLLYIGPGVYELGAGMLVVKPFVEVHGAGPRATVLRGNVEGDIGGEPSRGVVMTASDSVLRDMRVEHTGGVATAIAIYNQSVDRSTISYVTAVAKGGSSAGAGIANVSSTTLFSDVVAQASDGPFNMGIGIFTDDTATSPSGPVIVNTIVTASHDTGGVSYGALILEENTFASIQHSIAEGDSHSICVANKAVAHVAASQLIGSPDYESGTSPPTVLKCFGTYDAGLNLSNCADLVSAACPPPTP